MNAKNLVKQGLVIHYREVVFSLPRRLSCLSVTDNSLMSNNCSAPGLMLDIPLTIPDTEYPNIYPIGIKASFVIPAPTACHCSTMKEPAPSGPA